jgi:Tfp pilus assembly protein PilN
MNEIDLFPDDLRKRLLLLRWFKITGLTLVLVSMISAAGYFSLVQVSANIDQQIKQFQSQRKITTSSRNQLQQLNQQKKNLQQQLDLLAGLRSGASAESMFVTIDRALPGPEVWITNWKFRRAGSVVEGRQQTVSTGYFIVIPAGNNDKDPGREETWKIETNMNLQGQAMDHVAMTRFVQNLTHQTEIENVRIVSTRANKVNKVKLIDFSLDIIVSAGKGSV